MTLPDLSSPQALKELLDAEAARINSPSFIDDDPVQFPRRFSAQADIEIAALLASTIAWGNRRMICRDADNMLAMLDNRPHDFVMEQAYEELPDRNIHRTFFTADLRTYLRGLHYIYSRYSTLEEFARAEGVHLSEYPAWSLAEAINSCIARANAPGVCADPSPGRASRCLPQNLATTALKRLNMALRWLVRCDGIVDMGVWSLLRPDRLYIPLDVHVGNVSRQLGLLTRRNDDRKAVIELTEALRTMRPDDPVIYDYALFGIGIGIK